MNRWNGCCETASSSSKFCSSVNGPGCQLAARKYEAGVDRVQGRHMSNTKENHSWAQGTSDKDSRFLLWLALIHSATLTPRPFRSLGSISSRNPAMRTFSIRVRVVSGR